MLASYSTIAPYQMLQQLKENLMRFAGLLTVSLIGVLVIICGLTLAFGHYLLSMAVFLATIGVLIVVRIIIWRLSD